MKAKSEHSLRMLLSACFIALIPGCGEAKKGFDKAYDQAFVESWKSSFVSSCAKGDEKKLQLCTCVAEKSVANLPVDQLNNVEIIKERIVPQCK